MILQMADLKFTDPFQEVELVELLKASAQIPTLDGGDLKVKIGDRPHNLGEIKDNLEEIDNGILLEIGTIGEPKIDGILMLGVI